MATRLSSVTTILILAPMLSCSISAAPNARVTLEHLASRHGCSSLSGVGSHIALRSKHTTLTFETNSRKLFFNGLLIWMNGPAVKERGVWYITEPDTTKIIEPLLSPEYALASADCSTVVLDPGHGGRDTGAIGRRRIYEKKVVLDIAKRARKKLEASGITVKLTRERDYRMSCPARVAEARKWSADIFVSVHVNSARNSNAAGLETYVLPAPGYPSTAGGNKNTAVCPGNRHDVQNILLACHVHRQMLAQTGCADRGIRLARFDVLRNAPCPAILVECGFVSNRAEENRIIQKEYRDAVAEGISQGILEYMAALKTARSP